MPTTRYLLFPPFRLDLLRQRLRQGAEVIPLRRKTVAVLRYLVEHAGQVVTKEDLLTAVWPDTVVSGGVPTVCIRELRRALGDDPTAPRWIETVPRRGYRFIGQVIPESAQWTVRLVGREVELVQLHAVLEQALAGQRQIVFVVGEPGIGKTTLVDAFLERLTTAGDLWIARGQCVEPYGAGDAYLPVLEAASVAGMEFSAAAVAAGIEVAIEEVEKACQALVRREQLLRACGTEDWPDGTVAARYGFLHALYHHVLYEQVTVARRVRLHQRIGERLEAGYGARAGELAAELAMHFERGRDTRRAVQYLGQAGQNAIQRHAYREAIAHLTKGLELLQTLPDTLEHTQQELILQMALSVPLMMTKGYAAPEIEHVYRRAHELCQRIGKMPQLFPVLFSLWRFYIIRAEYQTASKIGEQLLRLAQRAQDPVLTLEAHEVLGAPSLFLDEFVRARTYLEQAIALYDPQQHRSLALLYGEDPGVMCRCFVAMSLWFLGYPDQAFKKVREAISLAQELSQPFSSALAVFWVAVLHQFRREAQVAQEQAEALMALAHEQGFPNLLAYATILHGWAVARQGQAAEGITQTRQGIAALRAIGQEQGRPTFLMFLAEACEAGGQAREGLNVLAEALDVVHNTGERIHEAELYRLKGEPTLKSKVQGSTLRFRTSQSEAEAYSRQAIAIARGKRAKSLELRAVVSLCRLWQQQGKKQHARQLLTKTYNWFTEGFDTVDLKEAKALLKELG